MNKNNLDFKDWGCEQSYSNCDIPPKAPGVYAITRPDPESGNPVKEVLYIGMSKNLYSRTKGHPIFAIAKKKFGYIRMHFLETPQFIKLEKELIKKYQPLYNKTGLK